MALPITNVVETIRLPPVPSIAQFYHYKAIQRQARPYDRELNYDIWHRKWIYPNSLSVGSTFGTFNGIAWTVGDGDGSGDPLAPLLKGMRDDALNLAIVRFNRAKGESAQLLVAAGEIHQTANMIARRATQLFRGFRALKSLRFYDAAKAFNLVRDKKPPNRRTGKTGRLRWTKHPIEGKYYPRPKAASLTRRTAQSFAALVLEYNFGWAPFVGDIRNSVRAIEQSIAYNQALRGSAKVTNPRIVRQQAAPGYLHTAFHSVTVRARTGALWTVSNPNYELSRRLGLVDLATAAVELMPFSFVANWFVNLNEWVGQLSDRYDPNVTRPWWSVRIVSSSVRRTEDLWFPTTPPVFIGTSANSYRRRNVSLPSVTLRVRQKWFTSFTRAANASSLLVTLFSKREAAPFLRL